MDKPYVHTEYPKHIYKADKEGNVSNRVVNTPQEFEAAGDGWAESPDEAKQLATEAASKSGKKEPATK